MDEEYDEQEEDGQHDEEDQEQEGTTMQHQEIDVEGKEEGQGMLKRLPNPGSELARSMGCTCAVLDNNHGYYPPSPPDGWWITEGCPLHKPNQSKGDGDEPF